MLDSGHLPGRYKIFGKHFSMVFIRIAEEEAPNLKPKCYYNKHYMRRKMKRKKRRKIVQSSEKNSSSVVKNPSPETALPIKETTKMKTAHSPKESISKGYMT